ncbi:hypothetical protein AB0392_15750 [Nonomuraea angiospora]|uniref:hypothetical protein n=1 Tax=Nonomuraea angiospora TaxID=46172 RepID=UPI00344EED4E
MKRADRVVMRLMLLMVVALGVVAMHTLGHVNGHGGMPQAAGHSSMQPLHPGAGMVSGEEPNESGAAGWVCLAILGVAVALLFCRLGAREAFGASAPTSLSPRSWSRLLRAPPIQSLTRTVVLRI